MLSKDVMAFISNLIDDPSILDSLGDKPTREALEKIAREKGFTISATDFCETMMMLDSILNKISKMNLGELSDPALSQVAGGAVIESALQNSTLTPDLLQALMGHAQIDMDMANLISQYNGSVLQLYGFVSRING